MSICGGMTHTTLPELIVFSMYTYIPNIHVMYKEITARKCQLTFYNCSGIEHEEGERVRYFMANNTWNNIASREIHQ